MKNYKEINMNKLLAALFVGLLSVSTVACSKEAPKATEVVSVVAQAEPVAEKITTPVTAPAEEKKADTPKTKRVCVDQTNPKTGKVTPVCRTIKIHKKFEGTKVPEKAPKK
jgi:hypothetical protein